ncbi:MAG: phosphate regulon sensor histidine kinase PhoR [Pseudohongiellaceae bacterium]
MLQDWRKELRRLVILMLVAAFIGVLAGQVAIAIIATLLLYLARTFYQLRRLDRWINQSEAGVSTSPPESVGFWGDIFDGIYRLQKRERQAIQRLQAILDKAQESSAALEVAIITLDNDGALDWWNDAAETLLGLKYPTDRHQAIGNLVRDPKFSDYFNNERYTDPLKLVSPVNKNIILEFQIALFGERERLIMVRDITPLHRLEQMRTDFVGNVSHELRTPITVISGYLENLLENGEDLGAKWKIPLQQMQQQARRMENIVRDLLLLSNLETTVITPQQEEVNLLSLLREISNDTGEVFQDREHELELVCDSRLTVKGVRGELYSAISNLVFNAAKYTPRGGLITLSAGTDTSCLFVEVSDNGIGIEEQHVARLTERFYRVDNSRSTDTGGTGLGLAIVKHILMRHNGQLLIRTEPGKGSRFVCRFPLNRLANQESVDELAE